jgi:autotransporter-associated beta strand protein
MDRRNQKKHGNVLRTLKLRAHLSVCAAAAGIFGYASNSWAVLREWDGGGFTTSWSDNRNWTADTPPQTNLDDVLIQTNVTGFQSLDQNWSIRNLTFSTTPGGLVSSQIGSNNFTLTLNNNSTVTLSSGVSSLVINGNPDLHGTLTIALATGVSVNVADSGANLELRSPIIGSGGSITKTGSGQLQLSRDNSYDGGTTISAGVLRITQQGNIGPYDAGSSPGNILTINAGEFLFNDGTQKTLNNPVVLGTAGTTTINVDTAGSQLTFNGGISGSGGLTKSGVGTLIISKGTSGFSTYSGPTVINGGTLKFGVNSGLPSSGADLALSSSATFDLNGNDTVVGTLSSSAASAAVVLGSHKLTAGASANSTFAGVISGTGEVDKAGSGELDLTGSNTFTGETKVNAGVLGCTLNALGSSSHTTVATSTTLNLLGTGGASSSSEPIYLNGSGASSYAALQDNYSAGTLTLSGAVTLQSDSSIGVVSGGTLSMSSTISQSGARSLTKTGSGTLTLSAADSDYTGATVVNEGVLSFANIADSGFGCGIGAGSSITIAGSSTAATLTYTGASSHTNRTVTLGAGGATIGVSSSSATLTMNGMISGSGSLAKLGSGTLKLTASDNYTGKTTIFGGVLSIAAEAGLGSAPGSVVSDQLTISAGTLQVTSGFTMSSNRGVTTASSGGTIDVSSGQTLTIPAALTAQGNFTKKGAGTLIVSKVVLPTTTSHTRTLAINDTGTLKIAANGSNSGTSVVEVLTIAGSTGSWNAKLDLNDNDLIIKSSAANRQTALDTVFNQIKTARNTSPSKWQGNGITSSTAAGATGGYTGLAAILNDNGSGSTIYSTFDSQSVDINSTLVKYTWNGDADVNGQIDGDDYFRIDYGYAHRNDSNPPKGYRNGDFDYSGGVDADDYFLIDSAFANQNGVVLGLPFLPNDADGVAIPEPSAFYLLSLGYVGQILRRRRGTASQAETVKAAR